MTTNAPRLLYEGPGIAGVTTTLEALGWGDFRAWERESAGVDRAVRMVQLEGTSLLVDKASQTSLWRPYLDPRHRFGGAPSTEYGLSRRDSLTKLDAVIFVADSQRARQEANTGRLERLASDLRYIGRAPERVPIVFQLNKRDLPAILSCDALRATLSWPGPARYVASIATRGDGVSAAVRAALDLLEGTDRAPAE